jgi:cytochrome oxidase Cu insertion factor (SCO1/SenC/PrrC family)
LKLFLTLLLTCCSLFFYGQDTAGKMREFDYEQYKKNQSAKYTGKPFREFEVQAVDKKRFSKADLQDKIVFVNFWFETCTPCIAELDGFNQLHDSLKSNQHFLFLSFTFDPDSTVRKVKSKYNIGYPVFHIDKNECYRLNFDNGFPASFVLDRNGIIQYAKMGGLADKQKATAELMKEVYPEILKLLLLLPADKQ